MLPGPTTVMVEVRITPSTPCTKRLHRPSLISSHTWDPPTGQRSMRVTSSTCKRRTKPTRLLLRPSIGNIARAAKNRQNRAQSMVISQQGSRSLARLRDEMMQTSTTQEYPSLIDTFFVAHIVNGEFLRDEDWRIYEEMRRLEAMGTYTDDEINRLARGGTQRGHIASVGRVLPTRTTASLNMFSQFESGGTNGSGGCRDEEEGADHHYDEDEDGDGDA
nr:F-box domain, leucine-rich repeat domain, L domain-like protein [Tanacetum cinerariifolium]